MELMRLPISASQRGKLLSAGYTSIGSVSSASASDLSRDLRISELEAGEILKAASSGGRLDHSDASTSILNGAQTAWDMLHEEDLSDHITTSCSDLDNILEGGIGCKQVTEIGGVPGIGKTQFGIQLAINVQLPSDFGGLEGKAIYIDTEGSFMMERALQIAEGCIQDMLESDCSRQRGYTEQVGIVNYLDKFVTEHKDVKLVIIDSITFHFRQDFEDYALRTRILSAMALKLMKLANKFNLAVVLLNQVTTKYTEGSYQLTLALGDSWAHASTNRLILYWNGDERHAYIDKSPSLRSASAPYSVTAKGIRNVTSNCKRIKLM